MNGIKDLHKYLRENKTGQSAKVLARLAVALADEREFPLVDLYGLPLHEFEMAIEFMRDWRLDRYYVARIRLVDLVVNEVLSRETSA